MCSQGFKRGLVLRVSKGVLGNESNSYQVPQILNYNTVLPVHDMLSDYSTDSQHLEITPLR